MTSQLRLVGFHGNHHEVKFDNLSNVHAINKCLKFEEDLFNIKGALYRIWCGVNRLGDSGVKVV